MTVTAVRHVFGEPDRPPSTVSVEFDRELDEREASEIAQLVNGLHERHEFARSFATTHPRHRRHVSKKLTASWLTEVANVEELEDGTFRPVIHPVSGEQTITRTFSGTCGDCGREYVVGSLEPYHYVCPRLPLEHVVAFGVEPCHPGCAIDCGGKGI